jgi:serine/threonine protein kinase
MQIVHRDIKVENILVQYRTLDYIEVKLADFGLSKDDDNLSTICGNRRHLAPEVYYNEQLTQAGIEGRKSYDSAIDIWSLGTVVYGLLCPFPDWKEGYEFKGTRWAQRILDRFWKDCEQRPNELKRFLLGAMVVIRPEQRWSAEACLLAAERIRLPAQSRRETPTPTLPVSRRERREIRNQGEQSTIVPNTRRRPISSIISSDSKAARRSAGSRAPSSESMRASRKRPTTVSTSSSSSGRRSKRREYRSSEAQSVIDNRAHNTAQDDLENEETVRAAVLWQQLEQGHGTLLGRKAGKEKASQTGHSEHPGIAESFVLFDGGSLSNASWRQSSRAPSYITEWEGKSYLQPFRRSEVLKSIQPSRPSPTTYKYCTEIEEDSLDSVRDSEVDNSSTARSAFYDNSGQERDGDAQAATSRLMHDRADLVYMVVGQQEVSMRLPNFQLNASQILTAANASRNERRKCRREFAKRGMHCETKGGKLWVPFPDGVFLCQAVGLEYDLTPLLSYPSLPLPPRSKNYLLTLPRCNQCIKDHSACDRAEPCGCCKASGLGNPHFLN